MRIVAGTDGGDQFDGKTQSLAEKKINCSFPKRVACRHCGRTALKDSKMPALYLWTDVLPREEHSEMQSARFLGYCAVDFPCAGLSPWHWTGNAADQKLYGAVRLKGFCFHHPLKKKI